MSENLESLLIASRDGHADEVARLLDQGGVDVNQGGPYLWGGYTALMVAIQMLVAVLTYSTRSA